MTDIELLKTRIIDSGMTVTSVCLKAGIKRETLYNRLNGKGEFTASEIVALSQVLRLTRVDRDKIFLSKKLN